jgi:N-acetylglutamate synthase-like GNAT family acetyltransferase
LKQATGIKMTLNSLQFIELPKQQFPLVNRFYKQVYKQSVANKAEQVFVLKAPQIVCAARIKTVQDCLFLTGVACERCYRGQGLASLLISRLLRLQTRPVYCFPYPHLRQLYQLLGFTELEPSSLPELLGVQYQQYNKHKTLLCMVYVRV